MGGQLVVVVKMSIGLWRGSLIVLSTLTGFMFADDIVGD